METNQKKEIVTHCIGHCRNLGREDIDELYEKVLVLTATVVSGHACLISSRNDIQNCLDEFAKFNT